MTTLATVNADAECTPGQAWETFSARLTPLRPWMDVAHRLQDSSFAGQLRLNLANGNKPADDPWYSRQDRNLLRALPDGHRLDVEVLAAWSDENALRLEAIRATATYGPASNPTSVRVATEFIGEVSADLAARTTRREPRPTVPPEAEKPGWEAFSARLAPLRPWAELARRLHDPPFAAELQWWLKSGGVPSNNLWFSPRDRDLLRSLPDERNLDVKAVAEWESDNAAKLNAVRQTANWGPTSTPASIAKAATFVAEVLADLARRGMLA